MLRGRYLETLGRLYRPFLYLALHQSHDVGDQHRIQEWADKAITVAYSSLRYGCSKHRHHGSWYGMRQTFGTGMVLLAAAESGRFSLPSGWFERVETMISILRYWEEEAPDLKLARIIAERLSQEQRLISAEHTSPAQ